MKRRKLSRVLTAITALLCIGNGRASAQDTWEVTSFQYNQTDVTAVMNPVKDTNNDACAMIKIHTGLHGLEFKGDASGIVRVDTLKGAYRVWVPAGARHLSIAHSDYPLMRYDYTEEIEASRVYDLYLQTYSKEESTTASNSQHFLLDVQPEDAKVFIDDEYVESNNGIVSITLGKGMHTYTVQADQYETVQSSVNLEDHEVRRSVRLVAQFGLLELRTQPEDGMEVRLNGSYVGLTPYNSGRLSPGRYSVNVSKKDFFPIDTTFVVHPGGRTISHTFTLKSSIKPAEPRRTIAILDMGFGASQTSFGAMVGVVSDNGAYLHFRSDFGTAGADLECDDTGTLTAGGEGTPYYKEGVSHKSRLSITAGYLRRIIKPLYLYAGAGYGKRTLAWETVQDELVKNTDHSADGLAFEFGGIVRMGVFALTAGYHTVNFKYHEASVGIGVIL